MRTNPRAMREYTPPTAMPVMISWSMNTRLSLIPLPGRVAPAEDANGRRSLVRGQGSSAPAGGDVLPLRVQLPDHVLVLHEDSPTADLLGPRELAIVGVQLLGEQREPANPSAGGEILVHARDRLRDQGGHFRLA